MTPPRTQRRSKKPTMPFALVNGGDIVFEPSKQDWQRIEVSYDHELSADDRKAIKAILNRYLLSYEGELNAPRVEDAKRWVLALKTRGEGLWNALLREKDRKVGDAASFAETFIAQGLASDPVLSQKLKEDFSIGWSEVLDHIRQFNFACDRALDRLSEMEAPGAKGLIVGSSWEVMIRDLTIWANTKGLPVGASHGDVCVSGTSPFVYLVAEIQSLLPKNARRSTKTPTALAKEINRARSRR